MDINRLVETIAREVLKQINTNSSHEDESRGECVIVLSTGTAELEAMVREYIGDKADICFLNDDPGTDRPCRHILPELTCKMMADLAYGRASGTVDSQILKLLLSGVEIETLEFEYKKYLKTAPGPMIEMYESYEKRLESFGLKKFSKQIADTVRLSKRLVTESDIIEAENNGASTLLIPLNANVTPLAQDMAKEMNVKLLKS